MSVILSASHKAKYDLLITKIISCDTFHIIEDLLFRIDVSKSLLRRLIFDFLVFI